MILVLERKCTQSLLHGRSLFHAGLLRIIGRYDRNILVINFTFFGKTKLREANFFTTRFTFLTSEDPPPSAVGSSESIQRFLLSFVCRSGALNVVLNCLNYHS